MFSLNALLSCYVRNRRKLVLATIITASLSSSSPPTPPLSIDGDADDHYPSIDANIKSTTPILFSSTLAMFAQYSPLFTSGLLSESNTPSTSRRPSIDLRPQKEARGSLPINVTDGFYETETAFSDLAESSPLYLTLMPSRRHVGEGRSFLSLDLAESQSMRSMSLRRKDTVTTRATTFFGRSVPTSPLAMSPTSPYMPSSFAHFGFHSTSAPADVPPVPQFTISMAPTVARRPSREMLSLPGVKPAPSSSLPTPPAVTRRRRPADLNLTLSTCLSASIPASSLHRASHSEPSLLSPSSALLSPDEYSSYLAFSPPTPPATSTSMPESRPGPVTLKATPSSCSTASFRTRQVNRSAALAALEGRTGGRRPRSSVRPRNFMSMSDDEDEGEEADGQKQLLEVLTEEEGVVVPTPAASRRVSGASPRKSRSRRGTLESFLAPLANFIDLGKDEDFPSWRSFVEISS